MEKLSKSKAIMSIALVVLVWGLVWPIYKVAIEYTPPLLFAGMRTLLGGILLSIFLFPKWKEIQWKKTWPVYVISSFFNIIIFNGVQTIGLQYLPSGLFSVIVYLQPVLVVLLAWLWLKESLTFMKIIGMLIGFIGVVIVSFDGISGSISFLGITLALITGIGWAIGVVYVKKTSGLVNGLWLVALQNIVGGVLLTASGMVVEDFSEITWNMPYVFSLLYGSILGVTVATALYYKLMSSGESSKVSSFTFLVPLIAVLIGTLFLHEPFTINLFAGMILILFSIYLINRKQLKKAPMQPLDKVGNF
ncbi:DMT family transporter [Caldibacillus lycopersici]|uniref:DMT family transporter n=1 Tax=Perspicuibacillus lycopersici TaxID=1325689 RepID=A0AAE3IUP6_9BACI|nr:DMT family transporter [Perspicuibacillus lycopersici]MCU9614975.1 DMT family transporter [Perspicuibacillus lycopersici]